MTSQRTCFCPSELRCDAAGIPALNTAYRTASHTGVSDGDSLVVTCGAGTLLDPPPGGGALNYTSTCTETTDPSENANSRTIEWEPYTVSQLATKQCRGTCACVCVRVCVCVRHVASSA